MLGECRIAQRIIRATRSGTRYSRPSIITIVSLLGAVKTIPYILYRKTRERLGFGVVLTNGQHRHDGNGGESECGERHTSEGGTGRDINHRISSHSTRTTTSQRGLAGSTPDRSTI